MTTDELDFVTAGAALAGKDVLDVDDLRLMYRLEMAGERFYEVLADGCPSDEAATLFRRNGREERAHAERVRKAIAIKLGVDEYEPDADDLRPLPVILTAPVPVEILPFVVQGELDGDASYERWADAEPDPGVQKLLRRNGKEETIHARRVEEALALLQPT